MENIKDLESIRKILPHGATEAIAKKAKVHRNTVLMYLKGKSKNFNISMALAEYIIEMKQTEKALYDAFTSYCENSN